MSGDQGVGVVTPRSLNTGRMKLSNAANEVSGNGSQGPHWSNEEATSR